MSMPQRQSAFRDFSLLTEQDLYLFNEGSHFRLHEKLGAHYINSDGIEGTYFAVWAPDAYAVYVIGSFNNWQKQTHPLRPRGSSGIWEGFFPDVKKGSLYKYHIVSRTYGYQVDKSDPFSIFNEIPPRTASIVWDLDYAWRDGASITRSTSPCRFTKCTWARGGACRVKAIARYRTVSSRIHWRNMCVRRALRTSSSCPSWIIPSSAHGAIRSRATSRPRRTTARRRILCISSTCCTRTGSASFSTGCRRISPPTSTAWVTSTARIFSSMPTRAKACIASGAATLSTTAATKSAVS